MTEKINSEWYFLSFVIFIAIFLIFKNITFPTNGVLSVVISQNKNGISKLDIKREITTRKKISLNSVDFETGRMLEHHEIGKLGNTKNFFMDIKTEMTVKTTGKYILSIASDDGFRMKIDKKTVCEHPGNRPMKTTTCRVVFQKGTHLLQLSYFQGGGPMGLKAYYQKADSDKKIFIGKNSSDIIFKAIKS
jgi:hypothetical protein